MVFKEGKSIYLSFETLDDCEYFAEQIDEIINEISTGELDVTYSEDEE